MLLSFI